MSEFKRTLKAAIISEYGTVEKWAAANDVLSSRFYNFLKGTYNPTISTLEVWLSSAGLEMSAKKSSKSPASKKAAKGS